MAQVKLVEVYDNSYVGLKHKYPTAFAIQPYGRGYKALVEEKDETNASSSD